MVLAAAETDVGAGPAIFLTVSADANATSAKEASKVMRFMKAPSRTGSAVAVFFITTFLCGNVWGDQETDSLRGLPPLVVNVTVEAPIPVEIGEADLKAAVEARLKSHGLKLAVGLEFVVSPVFFLSVAAPEGPYGIYGIGGSLAQFVRPWRPEPEQGSWLSKAGPKLLLETWHKMRSGAIFNGHPSISTRKLAELIVDDFASDYRKANTGSQP